MTVVVNQVRGGFYLDSVALMRLSTQLAEMHDVVDAVLMIGTDNNKRIMSEAGLLTDEGQAAGANDLVVALRAKDRNAADAAVAAAYRSLEEQAAPGNTDDCPMQIWSWFPHPGSTRSAKRKMRCCEV
jgi:FdrA protein